MGYMEDFCESARLRYRSRSMLSSDWIAQHTSLRGRPYSFVDHEYQIDFVNDAARVVVAEKPAQIGFTEILLRWLIRFLVAHQGSQAIMTQPTDKDMSNFAKSRVDVIFEECEIIGRLGRGVDSTQLKRIGSSFLNLRGTFGARAAISVPSDANIYDEVNFSNPRVLNQYKSRLQHSDYKYEKYISTPTIANYGVSAMMERSDKKRIWLRCCHCGHRQTIDWPESVYLGPKLPYNQETFELYVQKPWEYRPYIACKHCHREVDRSWRYREWVPEFQDREISGYKMSQLDVVFVSAADVLRASDIRLEGYKKWEDFENFVLGRPASQSDSVKINDTVKALCTVHLEAIGSTAGTFLGLDLGATCHWIVVKDLYLGTGFIPVVIAAGRMSRDDLEDGLPKLIKQFGCLYVVSDAQPYTTTVEKIAKLVKIMSCCYFGGKKAYTLSNENVTVTANRTMMLDDVTDEAGQGRLAVSDGIEDCELIWAHGKNLVKVKAEDDDGTEYYEYVKVGPDHYGYAWAYALLARKIWTEVRPNGHLGATPMDILVTKVSI